MDLEIYDKLQRKKVKITSRTKVPSDEVATPPEVVLGIMEFLPKDAKIWCPFDSEKSFFVRVLRTAGYKVIRSHAAEGKDFFEYQPTRGQWDIIVSNQPFSKKAEIIKRCLAFNKPFALLLPISCLTDVSIAQQFLIRKGKTSNGNRGKKLQLILPIGRPKFTSNFNPYPVAFLCYKILPVNQQIAWFDWKKQKKKLS